MAVKVKQTTIKLFILLLPLFITFNVVTSDDTTTIPENKLQLDTWFEKNVSPLSGRKNKLDPALIAAEDGAWTIKVSQDGTGDFKTVTEAVNSIPSNNNKRVNIHIRGGNYIEKIWVDRSKPFVTFYGDPTNMPRLVYWGTAATYGTVNSATLIVESDNFIAANIIVVNTAPRPTGKKFGEQAAAFRISGDKAAIYNSKFYGFQDTLCDDLGRHIFKDCYIEGTVDFVFGDGRSLYLNTELHVLPGNVASITAQARKGFSDKGAYSFVHCKVTGRGRIAVLGRAWFSYSKVVYAYTDMTDVVIAKGWSDHGKRAYDRTIYFGEYHNIGTGSKPDHRVKFVKKLSDVEVRPFLNLGFIEASTWLLPYPNQL